MICKTKRDGSVCQIKYNEKVLFVSVRRFGIINISVIGIGNVFETVHGNIFDDIGTQSINNCTLSNGSGVINRFIFKVRKLSVTNSIVAFTAMQVPLFSYASIYLHV